MSCIKCLHFQIEETVIECLAWQTNSPLWEDIRKSAQEIPKFEEIALPGSVVSSEIKSVTSNSESKYDEIIYMRSVRIVSKLIFYFKYLMNLNQEGVHVPILVFYAYV